VALSSGERRFFGWLFVGLALAGAWCLVLGLGTPSFKGTGSGCTELTADAVDQLRYPRLLIGATYTPWVFAGAWMAGWRRPRCWWQITLVVVWAVVGLAALLTFGSAASLAGVAFAAVVSAPVLAVALVARHMRTERPEPRYLLLFGAIIAVGGPLALSFAEPFSRWQEVTIC
jgi:hypothetical protein